MVKVLQLYCTLYLPSCPVPSLTQLFCSFSLSCLLLCQMLLIACCQTSWSQLFCSLVLSWLPCHCVWHSPFPVIKYQSRGKQLFKFLVLPFGVSDTPTSLLSYQTSVPQLFGSNFLSCPVAVHDTPMHSAAESSSLWSWQWYWCSSASHYLLVSVTRCWGRTDRAVQVSVHLQVLPDVGVVLIEQCKSLFTCKCYQMLGSTPTVAGWSWMETDWLLMWSCFLLLIVSLYSAWCSL